MKIKTLIIMSLMGVMITISAQSGDSTTSSTTVAPGSTSTTTGRPVPEIKPTPPTVATTPPETTVTQSAKMHKSDMGILKWLLANDPDKPFPHGVNIRTQILKYVMKNPQVMEAIEALRQKLQDLDSQDPNNPEVQKIVKEVRQTIRKAIAKAKLRGVRQKKGTTPVKQIAVGLPPDKPIPPPARTLITNPHKPPPPPPPPPPTTDVIPPPQSSTTTSTSSTTTTTAKPPGPPTIDPLVQQLIALLMQLLQKKIQGQSIPTEIEDLTNTLNKASDACKNKVKDSGGATVLSNITALLGKSQWTDGDKQQATSLKNDFCNIAKNLSECAGVCSSEGPPPATDRWKECKPNTTTSNCSSCANTAAQAICKVYTPINVLNNNVACKTAIGSTKYIDAGWFNSLLGTNADDTVATSALSEFKINVCSIEACKSALAAKNLNVCNQ